MAKRGREKKTSKQKQKTGRFQRKKTLRKEGANKNLQKIRAISILKGNMSTKLKKMGWGLKYGSEKSPKKKVLKKEGVQIFNS